MSEVMIRLKRLGTKKRPHSRIVVIDKHRSRNGRAIEELGYYDPSKQPPMMKVDLKRAEYWISKGATPSATVKQPLKRYTGQTGGREDLPKGLALDSDRGSGRPGTFGM